MNRQYHDPRRQWIQIAAVSFALILPFLSPPWIFALGIGSFIHNILLLPKYAPELFYRGERLLQGLAVSPLMIALLAIVMPDQINLIGCAWAVMGVGDSCAHLFGRRVPMVRLPWNREKSLGGILAFGCSATVAGFLVLAWIGPVPTYIHLLWVAFCASWVAAIYESLPLTFDDNVIVPLIAACIGSIIWSIDLRLAFESPSCGWWVIAFILNIVTGVAAWSSRWLTGTGAMALIWMGTLVLGMGGTELYILLILFFLGASLSTKYGYPYKSLLGSALPNQGRRGARQTYSHFWLAVFCSLMIGFSEGGDGWFALLFCAALATAISDIVAGELGSIYGYQAFMPHSFRQATPGTPGAISVAGTLCGLGAAFAFSIIAWVLNVIPFDFIPALMIGAWIGFFVESFIVSYWTEQGVTISKKWMNSLNPFIGGTTACMLAWITGAIS